MATLRDIADYVGISVSAASMALKDHRSISDETKRRVWEAQHILGYKMPLRPPAGLMKATAKATRDVVCLLVDRTFTNPTYATTFEAMAKKMTELHWRPIHLATSIEELRAGRIPSILRNGGVDGIIVSGAYDNLAHQHLRKLGIPIVVMGRYRLGVDPWMSCEPDIAHGIRLFLDRLSAFGHTQFGLYVETVKNEYSHHLRQQYLMQIDELCLRSTGIASDQAEPELGIIGIETLLAQGATAVLVGGRGTGVYETCQKMGLRIPEDISLIGLRSDSPPELSPPMSIINMHRGCTTSIVEKLGRLMDDPDTVPTRELYPMRLVPGASIGICSKK